jgi:hypothetical protein
LRFCSIDCRKTRPDDQGWTTDWHFDGSGCGNILKHAKRKSQDEQAHMYETRHRRWAGLAAIMSARDIC